MTAININSTIPSRPCFSGTPDIVLTAANFHITTGFDCTPLNETPAEWHKYVNEWIHHPGGAMQAIEHGTQVWGYVWDGRLAGFISLADTPLEMESGTSRELVIPCLGVAGEYNGAGLGTTMMRFVLAHAQQAFPNRDVFLHVHPDNGARRWYSQKFDFMEVETDDRTPGEVWIVMRRIVPVRLLRDS